MVDSGGPHLNCGETTRRIRTVCRSKLVERSKPNKHCPPWQHAGSQRGGLASSAWHIHKMGTPPRLGCLGMCTEQCAVIGISSKSWRNMFKLEMHLHTRQDKQGMRGKRWCRRCRRCAGERRRAPDGAGWRWRMSMRGGVAGPRP